MRLRIFPWTSGDAFGEAPRRRSRQAPIAGSHNRNLSHINPQSLSMASYAIGDQCSWRATTAMGPQRGSRRERA